MKIKILLASLARAAFVRDRSKCVERVNFDGIDLNFDSTNEVYTSHKDVAKLAQNKDDKTWMFLSVLSQPLVSFDGSNCVEDTKTWFRLGRNGYRPVNIAITKNP